MKLRTKVPVTHIDVSKLTIGQTKESIITIEIVGSNLIVNEASVRVESQFNYIDEDGNVLPSTYGNVFTLSGTQLKNMSESIQGILPTTNNIVERFNAEVKLVAIQQMSETFNIPISEIEEVEESEE